MPAARPLAFFITFRTYGTWLHGDARGSVDDEHNVYGTALIRPNVMTEIRSAYRMTHPAMVLSTEQRAAVDLALLDVARHRGWTILAAAVRTNHVHIVCEGDAGVERMMGDFKRWSTKRLRESGLVAPDQPIWAVHGSTRYVWTEVQLRRALSYVVNDH